MALVGNSQLFPMAFQEYEKFLSENKVVTGTPQAEMVDRVGRNIRAAAEKWFASEGKSSLLKDYRWEYKLVESKEVNAWCMPGGKIVIYTGILPVTQTEDGLATVMGHEVAHALLNHGQQRMSAGVLQELGGAALSVATDSALIMAAYGIGTTLGGTLPFSRGHESEADHYGLILMAIAGYNPEAAVPFWQRMSALGGGTIEFLSTHPSSSTRIRQLQGWVPEAKTKAAQLR
jgi:predicted Zn-dependent protease